MKKIIVFFLTVLLMSICCLPCDGSAANIFGSVFVPNTDEQAFALVPDDGESGKAVTVSADGSMSDLLLPDEAKAVSDAVAVKYSLGKKAKILIYHSHTTEAYRQEGDDTYIEESSWRTTDKSKSVVKVGEELKRNLEDLGYSVIHDTTNYEPPALATSYSRSEQGMMSYKKKYPDIEMFIDLHRDAKGDYDTGDYVEIDGKKCARVMFVVGKGTRKSDAGKIKPDWKTNLKLASKLTEELRTYNTKLARDVRIKTGRYNQAFPEKCVLIEIGHNMNTLQEAINSTKYVADAISRVLPIK